MRKTFFQGVGGILSTDIAVPDHERELDFYAKILTTGDNPLWRKDLMNNRGTPIIGLGARTPEYEALPLQWMPHFQVADVGASAARTLELGGQELFHGKGDDGQSLWAALVDPAGAGFGVIPVVSDESYSIGHNEHVGCISWLSLTVPDSKSSRDFYQHVVGWNTKSIEIGDSKGQYTNFEMRGENEITAAEICQHRNEHKGIPSVWLIYLPVDDLFESLRLVSENGGEIIKEVAEEKYAVVRDPVGVYLALRSG